MTGHRNNRPPPPPQGPFDRAVTAIIDDIAASTLRFPAETLRALTPWPPTLEALIAAAVILDRVDWPPGRRPHLRIRREERIG